MKRPLLVLLAVSTFLIAQKAPAVLVGDPFQFSDLTTETPAAWSDGGTDTIGFSRPNIGNTAQNQAALATVTDFTPGLDFTLTGSFSITNNTDGNSGTTTNRMSVFGLTLFGNTADFSSGIFAGFVITENRPTYDAGQRLFLGTNRPSASTSYLGNLAGGAATSGGTFLTGSNTPLANGATPTYTFTVSVDYQTASLANISFEISDGTFTNSLLASNVDLTGYTTSNVFGITAAERNRSLEGTFSDITINQVPEPSAALLLLGAVGAGLWRRVRGRLH